MEKQRLAWLHTAAVCTLSAALLTAGTAAYAPGKASADAAVSAQAEADVNAGQISTQQIREEILKLDAMGSLSLEMFGSYDLTQRAYADFIDAQREARTAALDPSTSSAKLSSTARNFERALNKFNKAYMIEPNAVLRLFEAITKHLDDDNGGSEELLTPAQRHLLQGVREAYKLIPLPTSPDQKLPADKYAAAYMLYTRYAVESMNMEGRAQEPDYALLAFVRADIQTRLPSVRGDQANYAGILTDFEQSASMLQSVLDQNLQPGSAYAAAYGLQLDYDRLLRSFEISERIADAQLLLESPKGSGVGQYPASAFGALNKAIKEAKIDMNKARSASALFDIRTELEQAIENFKSRLHT